MGFTSQRTRDRLIQRLRESGIRDERVLEAMLRVPRHAFVDEALASRAYEDTALPIGHNQTISQPYIVARMTEALLAGETLHKVLEVGSGSGYQTAILAALVDEVFSVERVEPLLRLTRRRLQNLGYRNFRLNLSDGSWGWEEHGPYDGIMVTAAPEEIPEALCRQLAPGARMVIPVGQRSQQELILVTHGEDGYRRELLERVNFVPLVRDNA
ncbi:MAG: protein-L-isoaspartate(D-aspartate) O-methyltransferase [Acidiferrobacterales bacterium]